MAKAPKPNVSAGSGAFSLSVVRQTLRRRRESSALISAATYMLKGEPMNRQTVRLNDQELETLKALSVRDRTTISDSIRRLIVHAKMEKSEPVSDLMDRLESLELKASKLSAESAETNVASGLELQIVLAEIEKHRTAFAQVLTALLLVLPTDEKQFARSAAEMLSLKP